MDTVIITHPVTTIVSPDCLAQIVQFSTLILAAVAIAGLGISVYQNRLSRQGLQTSVDAFNEQRQEIREEHSIRLKRIMPWFRPNGFGGDGGRLIMIKNIGGRAHSISVGVQMIQSYDTQNASLKDLVGLTMQDEVARADAIVGIEPVIIPANGPIPAAGVLRAAFRLSFQDDLDNWYIQECSFEGREAKIVCNNPRSVPEPSAP